MNFRHTLTSTFNLIFALAFLINYHCAIAQQLYTPESKGLIVPTKNNFSSDHTSLQVPKESSSTANPFKEKNKKIDYDLKSRGYINITEGNLAVGIGYRNEDRSLGIITVNGYQFNEHFSLGLGLGFDKYTVASLVPITLDIRTYLLKGIVSPVIILNGGYAFGISNAFNGHIFHPQIGLKVFISNNAAFLVNIGYKMQSQQRYPDILRFTNSTEFHFATLSIGFSF